MGDVWSAMTQARTNGLSHSSTTPDVLFALIDNALQKKYVVSSAADVYINGVLVGGHAFAVLGVYNVTLDNGNKVKFVRYFNPWHQDANIFKNTLKPWGDTSSNWTNYVKSQVPYMSASDGIEFSDVKDFINDFSCTSWGELHDNYDVSYIDIGVNSNRQYFEVNFTYYGDPENVVYIFYDNFNDRNNQGGSCPTPFSLTSISVIYQNGTKYGSTISNAPQGTYKAKFQVTKNKDYMKYFTLTAYTQAGKFNFVPLANNQINDIIVQCPNNCNLQGRCNTFDGTCTCYFGVNKY